MTECKECARVADRFVFGSRCTAEVVGTMRFCTPGKIIYKYEPFVVAEVVASAFPGGHTLVMLSAEHRVFMTSRFLCELRTEEGNEP